MKVRVALTIEIDPKDWTLSFGVEGAQEIREDVKSYVLNLVQQCAALDPVDGDAPGTVTLN